MAPRPERNAREREKRRIQRLRRRMAGLAASTAGLAAASKWGIVRHTAEEVADAIQSYFDDRNDGDPGGTGSFDRSYDTQAELDFDNDLAFVFGGVALVTTVLLLLTYLPRGSASAAQSHA